jgi:hypothetical protein
MQDMRQVWINCALYNKKDTPVAKMGSRADAKFEQLWAASGFDQGGRRRRVTGGIAAHKYEPSLEPEHKPPARKTNSGQRSGRRVSGNDSLSLLLLLVLALHSDLSFFSLCLARLFLRAPALFRSSIQLSGTFMVPSALPPSCMYRLCHT